MSSASDQIWERAASGRHTLVLGHDNLSAPTARKVCLLEINCADLNRPLEPLLEARDLLSARIGETRSPLILLGEPPPADDLHQRLLDEEERAESLIVELANRLQRQLDVPLVLSFSATERADPDTLQVLERLMAPGSGLRVGLLLLSPLATPVGALKRIAAAVTGLDGPGAIVQSEEPTLSTPPQALAKPPLDLPFDVLRVLRAGAIVGETFEAALVADVLGLDLLSTLELLQMARDGGAELDDRGEGVFRLTKELRIQLHKSTTPSLAHAWHRVLAEVLGRPQPTDAGPKLVQTAPAKSRSEGPLPLRGAVAMTPPQSGPSLEGPEARPDSARHATTARQHKGDASSRAAEHAEAAGDLLTAAERYLEAAHQAARIGGHGRAIELLERALAIIPATTSNNAERLMRINLWLELGRTIWRAAGHGSHNLDEALRPLDAAANELEWGDPAELRAEVGTLIAQVSYDIGAANGLERALAALGDARQALLDAGKPLSAARLLNDEAAVWVRLGDHQRAARLLRRSRDVFVKFADETPIAQLKLAQTDHLVGRLALHAPEDEQRDPQTLQFALECATSAERSYAELGAARERARVWETLGSLTRLANRRPEALKWLQAAAQAQQADHDAIGLARSTAALSELLVDEEKCGEALDVLKSSVALNLKTGSRQGIVYNRRGLQRFTSRLGATELRRLKGEIDDLAAKLEKGVV